MKYSSTYLGIMLLFSCFVIAENIYATTLADDNEWELRKDKNGIKVYTKTHAGSRFIECKVQTTAKTELSKLIRIINDVENYPVWMANCKSASVFSKTNDSLRIYYQKTRVPWPMHDRDVVLEYRTVTNNDEHYEATINSITGVIPEKENIVRIKDAKGRWVINMIDKNTVEITYQYYGDPGRNIPSWLINMFIVNGPYETLLNLKNSVI